ncbi:Beta-barrel assembly-enhancing protease [bacterium HR15]|nr:Beta-barrel assembly-enhancing protease [bacterium HR15]
MTVKRAIGDTRKQQSLLWLGWAVVPALVIVCYLPALTFGFVWDDEQMLFGRADYHDPSRWLQVVRQPLDFSPNYFRPLALSTLLVQIWLWRDNPMPFHLLNVLLHGLNTVLVMALAWRLLRSEWGTVLAGLLYGLHPALTESVAFIASRYDLAVTTFLLLALMLSTSAWRWRSVGVALCFLLAALCKEMAIVLPLLLPAWQFALSHRAHPDLNRRARLRQMAQAEWPTYLALIVAGLLYLGLRYASLGYLHQSPSAESRIDPGSPIQHLLLIGRTFTTLIGLVFFPFFSISPAHHTTLPIPLNDWVAWVQLTSMLSAIVVLVWLTRRVPMVGWLFVAGAMSLLPVLNIRPLEMAKGIYTAERFLTFPLVLFVLGVAAAWRERSSKWQAGRVANREGRIGSLLLLMSLCLWLVMAVVVILQNLPNWKENRTLWEWMTRASPRSPIGYSNLADTYNKLGRYEDALKAAERAIQIAPYSGMGWVNKGVALLKLGHPQEAEAHFRKATELEPENVIGWNNLAIMLSDRGEFIEAERIVRQHVLGRTPRFMGHQALGILYLKQGRPDLAEPELERALQALPFPQGSLPTQLLQEARRPNLWLAAAERMIQRGDLATAARLCQRAEQLGADRIALAYVRGKLLIAQGRPKEAERLARELIDYGLNDPRLYAVLRAAAQSLPTKR